MNAREAALERDRLARERLKADPISRIVLARGTAGHRPCFRGVALQTATAALTERECAVLQLAANGLKAKAIAAAEVVSVETVKSRLQSIYRKFDLRVDHPFTAAVAIAIRRGLIQ